MTHPRQYEEVAPCAGQRTHERVVATIDNPGRGEGQRIDVVLSDMEDVAEGYHSGPNISVDGVDCVRPETAYEVVRAVLRAATLAGGEPPTDGIDPRTLDAIEVVTEAIEELGRWRSGELRYEQPRP